MELEGIFSLIKRVHNIFSPQNILGGRGRPMFYLWVFCRNHFSQANKKIKYKKTSLLSQLSNCWPVTNQVYNIPSNFIVKVRKQGYHYNSPSTIFGKNCVK